MCNRFHSIPFHSSCLSTFFGRNPSRAEPRHVATLIRRGHLVGRKEGSVGLATAGGLEIFVVWFVCAEPIGLWFATQCNASREMNSTSEMEYSNCTNDKK
mmetsp:Transcript_21677/g.51405  ORF Transcript_21677/g.51405 Transcript_21677/m.51405 type:complete len:100 (-) Transcript_21677:68-367(-)